MNRVLIGFTWVCSTIVLFDLDSTDSWRCIDIDHSDIPQ